MIPPLLHSPAGNKNYPLRLKWLNGTVYETENNTRIDTVRNSQIRNILQVVAFQEEFHRPLTSNQIARECEDICSRSTAYRWLRKCEKMELLDVNQTNDGNKWTLTGQGWSFLEKWKELPF